MYVSLKKQNVCNVREVYTSGFHVFFFMYLIKFDDIAH